jgi:hypothetical protein
MKQYFICSWLMLFALAAVAQSSAKATSAGSNPLADPFQTHSKVELPPSLSVKLMAMPLPPVPPPAAPAPVPTLPTGLRVVLLRHSGQGLLGTADLGAASIPVSNGKTLHLTGHDYLAEVTDTQIRLYTAPKGKLIWEGTLGGPAMLIAPADMSQAKFTPPISAGVSPGLGAVTTGTVAAK